MKTITWSLLSLVLVLSSCQEWSSQKTVDELDYGRVSVSQAKQLVSNPDIVIIDVRTPEEWAEGIIPGAQKVDYLAGDVETQLAKLDKSKEYLVYCRSGNRSQKSMALMNEAGFDKVYELKGGYKAWSAQ